MNDKERGLYKKYEVVRRFDVTGKHNNCDYFVLDPTHDEFAISALLAYADACEKYYPLLARDVRRMTEAKRGDGGAALRAALRPTGAQAELGERLQRIQADMYERGGEE